MRHHAYTPISSTKSVVRPSEDGWGRTAVVYLKHVSCVPLAVILFVVPCLGQTVSASLYGTVTDPAKAVVPDASIVATNVGTGIVTKTATDSTGNYLLPSLSPATYSLTVEKVGFKTTVLRGITLLVDQNARLDVQMQVGQVASSVEVTGDAPLVETGSASVGTVVGSQQMVDLPLNVRHFGALALLVPGAVTANGGSAASVNGSPFSDTTYSENGNRSTSNNLLLDGVESRSLRSGTFGLQPPPDAVEEFKIQTNIYSAAFGITAGSTINVVTKSGTNSFHGGAYEFLRKDAIDARNFFATSKPEYRRNQFGANFGGPIRKNKTFIFGYYEGLREVQGLSLSSLVPTDAQKQGNLSSFLTGKSINLCGSGGPASLDYDTGQLFIPSSESLFTCPAGSAKAGSTILVGNPVPGNIIRNIDSVAAKVLQSSPLQIRQAPQTSSTRSRR
jgi:hypothetical protein